MLRRFWLWGQGEWIMVIDLQMQGGPESETGQMDYDFMHCMTEIPLSPPLIQETATISLEAKVYQLCSHSKPNPPGEGVRLAS